MIQEMKNRTLELRKNRSHLGPVMQFHLAEISKIGKSKNRDATEDEAIQYTKKALERLRSDPHSDQDEIQVLDSLLPQMASKEEVEAFLNTLDKSNKGLVMKAVREKYGALVDMKMVGGMI